MIEKKLSKTKLNKYITVGATLAVMAAVGLSCVWVLSWADSSAVPELPEVIIAEDPQVVALKNETYYLEVNKERYLAYLAEHEDLSFAEVVRDVNINLDKTRYEDDVEADVDQDELVLVSKYYHLPDGYVPDDLVTLSSTYNNGSTPQLARVAAEAFMKMADAARKDGVVLRNVSGYRSYNLQKNLYAYYAARDGAEGADTYSSRAGYSEHQTGLATDINLVDTDFQYTPAYDWLQEHAAEYGFIMRYPEGLEELTGFEFEPWHYRYVGPEVAQQIVHEGITYDEYYAYYVEGGGE